MLADHALMLGVDFGAAKFPRPNRKKVILLLFRKLKEESHGARLRSYSHAGQLKNFAIPNQKSTKVAHIQTAAVINFRNESFLLYSILSRRSI